jgi:hypothetical protein
MKDSFH